MTKVLFIVLAFSCFSCKHECAAEAQLAALRDSLANTNPGIQNVIEDPEKEELLKSFDMALARLDSLVGYNIELEKKLTERNEEVKRLKEQLKGK